jgi:predicted DsbA family dithiol-disulfide isomerase
MNYDMKIEIWSDVLCPFCYIGKRHFEKAFEAFDHRNETEIIWRSFELNPDAPREQPGDIYDALSKKFNTTREQVKQMNQRVIEMAKAAGLNYNMDAVKATNSFDAHRLIHLAAKHGLQDKAEEKLFSAYFIEGRNIGDHATLEELAVEIGLDKAEAAKMLSSEEYTESVRADEDEAQKLRITGVPFFVFDRKYAVSGAQPVEVFEQTMKKVWEEKQGGAN